MRRPRLNDEAGFTIVELMMACMIGVIVIGSATMITIGAARHNSEVANRTDATQRGRLALEKTQRLLRSQVCTPATTQPITAASANSITVTTDLSDGSRPIERHTITLDTGGGRLTDTVVPGSGDPVSFAGTGTTATLATDVRQTNGGPFLRYWAYPVPAPASGVLEPTVELNPGAGSLSAADLSRIAKIDISFSATGATKSTRKIAPPMTDSVFVRIADPNDVVTDPNDTTDPYNPTCS